MNILHFKLKQLNIVFGSFSKRALLLLVILLTATLFETLGIGMILPLLQMIIHPEKVVPLVSSGLKLFRKEYHLLLVCLMMLLMIGCKTTFTLLKIYYSNYFINDLRRYWSSEIMEKFLFSNYIDLIRHKQGVLLNNMVHETSFASKALRDLVDLTANGFIVIGLSILLLLVNWRFTLVIGFIAFASHLILGRFAQTYAIGVGQKKIQLNQQITQSATESIAGIRQVKIFSLEKNVLVEFVQRFKQLVNLMVRFRVISALPIILGEILMVILVLGLILFYGYWAKSDVVAHIPVLSLFTVSALRLFPAVSKLLAQRMSISSYWPSLILVHDLCNEINSTERVDEGKKIRKLTHSIAFEHVNFEFNNEVRLFKNLCLEIPKSRITAVVGLSGAGKSTLCDLITKFYVPTNGKIILDGINLADIRVQSWRRRIGYVSQDTFLFNTSIAENIAIGLPEGADHNRVVWAADRAGVSEFIETLPEGYQTPVGHGGVTLSGGERQRIAIARALIRDPDLIIFDEATSSLDSKIERQILKSIKNISKNKAVLFITHRLSSLWIADFIYFLENGQIIESGSYQSLMESKGTLWKLLQMSEHEDTSN